MKKSLSAIVLFVLVVYASVFMPSTVYATDGMNLEGYGPIATGMGGASMAYDNGTAAMMNNPATLGLMPDGNRLDVALGYLGPHITVTGPRETTSQSNAFYMPAIGWIQKSGQSAYGVGVFAQGGMGAKYDANSFLAQGTGDYVGSQLGVGRVIVPFAYNVTPDLIVAASVDFVWADLDLKMALPGSQFAGLVTSCSGPACAGLPILATMSETRLDFWSGGPFSGAATGTGYAGKLGATYKINSDVSIGATYHSKTSLNDLKTKSDGASLSAGSPGAMGALGAGQISVRDFQWPETYAVGVSWNATKELMVVFDIKQINWSGVMKNFKMTYDGTVNGANATIDFAMPQNWKDQTVFELGAGYIVSPEWILRAGLNITNNPIPNTYLNALFPAIEENHLTLGAGYMISKASSVDASFTYAPRVAAVSDQAGAAVYHMQNNAQVMYSYRF